jgi:hypothetical protein
MLIIKRLKAASERDPFSLRFVKRADDPALIHSSITSSSYSPEFSR